MIRRSTTLALALGIGLAGCGTTVKLLPENLNCPVPDARLAAACAAPQTLADGASFQQLIGASIADRQALQQCELRRRELAAAIQTCNQAVIDYMAEVRKINAAAAAKP